MAKHAEEYDLLIIVDATYSMGDYLAALQTSLPKIIAISSLTDSFSRIGLLAYRDYTDDDRLEWSGWLEQDSRGYSESSVDLLATARGLVAYGGEDYPEAVKTALAKAYQEMREDATTVILLYTDAPPHTVINGGYNYRCEQLALRNPDSYGGFGSMFTDWVRGSRTMAMKEGKKRAQVFSILEPNMYRSDGNYYAFLSTITGGACFYLDSSRPDDIARVTVDILLAWMGVGKEGTAVTSITARIARFKSPSMVERMKREMTAVPADRIGPTKAVEELPLNSETLKIVMPKKKTPVQDFAQRYKSDSSYRLLVARQLQNVIDQDVSAISLNPVFGSLWRAVCKDRASETREQLATSFGLQVDKISDATERERMKTWLEGSYDYSADVAEAIGSVPDSQKFPCVYLDPTIAFTKDKSLGGGEKDGDDRPITEFLRDELLGIGRSCDYRILKRLGRVLTRVTFANTPEELPAHIVNAEEKITLIPMALASKEFGRRFWGILLHIIVPGTMLSDRPAALLAALTIRLGIQPLFEAADAEMLMWRDKWNDLKIPETWNISCLSLLLDADRAYVDRHQGSNSKLERTSQKGLLLDTDRKLFDRLISYKMLELNLQTSLTVDVSWTPAKTLIPIGPLVNCRSCQYPRSVTIMGPKGKCGVCMANYPTPQQRQKSTDSRVTKDDDENTAAIWVECSIRTCRVQYVVYDPEALNVRPKCHYCREQSSAYAPIAKRKPPPAPYLECSQCLNRVIYPTEYRPHTTSPFKCVPCSSGRSSISHIETNAQALSKENGIGWLLENREQKLEHPFGGRSLFQQMSQAGTEDFCKKVVLFPNPDNQSVVLKGKVIQNYPDLVTQLKSWITRRHTESGTCSLCFSDFRKADLNPACGRRGCEQRLCRNCLNGWYGLNSAGRIINTAALSCPFCRRAPTAKTLHSYGMGIHAVGDLKQAVDNAGEWVYAWCVDCARAKQYLQRVCAAGAPRDLANWVCESCELARQDAAQREIEALEQEAARMEAEARRTNYERGLAANEALRRANEAIHEAKKKIPKIEIKKCPQCRIPTEKLYGCGHMTCICDTHWCWFCGERKSFNTIYEHMNKVHNGWYDDDDDDDEMLADDD